MGLIAEAKVRQRRRSNDVDKASWGWMGLEQWGRVGGVVVEYRLFTTIVHT